MPCHSEMPIKQPGREHTAAAPGLSGRGQVFGPHARLRTREQLDWVREHGQRRVGRLCLAVVAAAPPDHSLRVSFLISRRFSRKAVVRNRARRLFREVYRRLSPRLAPVWLLLIPRQYIMQAKMGEVEREVSRLLEDILGEADTGPTPAKRNTEDSAEHVGKDG